MADPKRDNYQPLDFYRSRRPETADATGFFKVTEGGEEYFAYQAEGRPLLVSQSYKARAGRDNGIVSTRKNMALAEQYDFQTTPEGKHYFNVLARNKQQVASSVLFDTETEARAVADYLTGKRKDLVHVGSVEADSVSPKVIKAANREQNYMPREFYESRSRGVGDGFHRFDNDGQHYFTFNEAGRVLLVSEGYPDAKARDRGVASVEKNMRDEKRYRADETNFSLRAGNNKEIARGVGGFAGVAAATAGAAALYAPKAATKARAGNVEQNYKPLAFFEARIQGVENGFDTFVEDGQHYFTFNRDGKIELISEGYPSAAARDKGIASVTKNMTDESKYSYGPVGGGFEGYRLKAGNNKEIARSIGYPTAAAAAAGAALLFAPRPEAAAVPVQTNVAPEPKPAVTTAVAGTAVAGGAALAASAPIEEQPPIPVERVDEGGVWGWLKWVLLGLLGLALLLGLLTLCSDDEVAPVAVVDEDDRLECPNGEMVDEAADCASVTPALAAFIPASALADNRLSEPEVEAARLAMARDGGMVICPEGEMVDLDDGTCPTATDAEMEEARDMGFLSDARLTAAELRRVRDALAEPEMVECADGSMAESFTECPPVEEAAPVEVAEPVRVRETGNTAQAIRGNLRYTDTVGTCDCATGSSRIFETEGAQLAVIVDRLGTNPEFGNVQGLSPQQFYDRLNAAWASDSYDRNYLEYLARSLGYSGWQAMDASMFSDTTIPNGTRAILGYGSQHALQYSRLDLERDDINAFRVRAANGCDVNFMKTCGNYAYVCE